MINYLSFGIRNLRRRGIRSWLTLLGIFIGIAAVVALISLGSGLKTAVNSQFGVSTTQVITVQAGGLTGYGPPGSGVDIPLTKDDALAIERISGVEYAIPRNLETSKVTYNGETQFLYVMSMPDNKRISEIYDALDWGIESGRELKETDSKKVLVGYNYLDSIKNGFDKEITPGKKIEIGGKSFEVIGVLEQKGSFVFDNIIAMKDNELEEIAGYGDNVDIIAVKVRSSDQLDKVKTEIENLLRQRRDVKKGQEDFSVETPDALLGTVNDVLGGVQIFIIIIASISVIVGAIGITNTMTTSVLERTKEIGIMKAIGARNENIFFQFLIESGLLGLIGGILGVVSGLGVGFLGIIGINNFIGSQISLDLNWIFIISVLLLSFLVGSVSGIVPALQAAQKNPVEAIRR